MPADDTVCVTVAVNARVQEVHVHEILRVSDGIRARTCFSLREIAARQARRLHDALVHTLTVVISSRIETRICATQVSVTVGIRAGAAVGAAFMRRDADVPFFEGIRCILRDFGNRIPVASVGEIRAVLGVPL